MDYIGTTINNSATIVMDAKADMPAQGVAVAVADGKAVKPTAGANAIGIALFSNNETAKAGEDVQIQIKDIGKMIAAGKIAVGDEIATDADGKAVKAATGKFIIGTALTAASAAGSIIEIQITKSGYKA